MPTQTETEIERESKRHKSADMAAATATATEVDKGPRPALGDALGDASNYRLGKAAALGEPAEDLPGSVQGTGLALVVFGASGDLAKRKTFPAIYALYKGNRLPPNTKVFGYARSALTDDNIRAHIREFIPGSEGETLDRFLSTVSYVSGAYDKEEGFLKLRSELEKYEASDGGPPRRLLYLALPPSVYPVVTTHVSATLQVDEAESGAWSRVILEKPFGRDTESSDELSLHISKLLPEKDLYRIDHFLGKEIVLNLLAIQFGNVVFRPLMNRHWVSVVQITFKETLSTEGRAGYFDSYGIIRDVMQNHLMQVLTLFAMDDPASLGADDVRDEKRKVLKSIPPITPEDIVIGQYGADPKNPKQVAYRDEDGVPKGSNTPTFATCILHINNERWRGVPFIMKAAKGVEEAAQVVRVQFKESASGLYEGHPRNELVMRLSPDEAVYMKTNVRVPGSLEPELVQTELDLSYKGRFKHSYIPQAYERLIYDCIRGDQTHFVRSDELRAAWEIFTPILKQIDAGEIPVHEYEFGSRGPKESDELVTAAGYQRDASYVWTPPTRTCSTAGGKGIF